MSPRPQYWKLEEEYELSSRVPAQEMADRVWTSDLCSDHKLLMLAVIELMSTTELCYATQRTLAARSSMSRDKLRRMFKQLRDSGWLEQVSGDLFRGAAGRAPVVHALPKIGIEQDLPDHCGRLRGRVQNLRRGHPATSLIGLTTGEEELLI